MSKTIDDLTTDVGETFATDLHEIFLDPVEWFYQTRSPVFEGKTPYEAWQEDPDYVKNVIYGMNEHGMT